MSSGSLDGSGRFDEAEDDFLVEAVRGGDGSDLRAFEVLVDRYQDRIKANCRHLSGSATDAEDLAQEVFVKAYFGMGRFEGRARFSTWLQRIKVNHCINFMKKKRHRFVDVDDPVVQQAPQVRVNPEAERRLGAEDTQERIRDVLDQMNETLRIPLIMCDMDELSYQEIADELGIGLSAVKMRIKRGREEFRRLFEQEPERMTG